MLCLKPQIITKEGPELTRNVERIKKVFKKNKNKSQIKPIQSKYAHNTTIMVVRFLQVWTAEPSQKSMMKSFCEYS